MWWCFLCFFFVCSLVFQFYVLGYGIHFCRRDFWIVLFVPFHIFICLRVTYQYMWFCHSCYTRTCNLYLLLWSSLRLFAMHLKSAIKHSQATYTLPDSLRDIDIDSPQRWCLCKKLDADLKVFSLNLLISWCTYLVLRVDSPWLTLRLWAQPVSHLMLETFRRRPFQAIRGMTCKRHFSCGYFTEQQTFLKVQV